MKYKSILVLIFISISICCVYSQNEQVYFKTGDRVCFVGNSITMGGDFHHNIALAYALGYPELQIRFFNCGISGDVTKGILKRLESDILVKKPTCCVLMAGMNDVKRDLYSNKASTSVGNIQEARNRVLEEYYLNLEEIIKRLIGLNIRVLLQTPTIFDQTAKLSGDNYFGVNDALGECSNHVKLLARKYDLPVIDYYSILLKLNNQVQVKDSAATIIGSDRVHPGSYGHFVMAYQFLKSGNFNSIVSEIEINTHSPKTTKTANCDLIDLSLKNKKNIIFSYKEKSLPFPRLSVGFKPDSLVSFTNDFNMQIVKVKGLAKGKYKFLIDEIPIGIYTSEEYSKGINLANIELTPQNIQAKKVLAAYRKCWEQESILRTLKYVEYSHLKDFKNKENVDSVKNHFTVIMTGFEKNPQPYSGFFKKSFDSYLLNKPNEKDIENKFDAFFEEIYKINKPVIHQVVIRRE